MKFGLGRASREGRRAAVFVLIRVAWSGVANGQEIAVQNESGAPVKLTAAEIAALPHQQISVDDHGKTVRFEGGS